MKTLLGSVALSLLLAVSPALAQTKKQTTQTKVEQTVSKKKVAVKKKKARKNVAQKQRRVKKAAVIAQAPAPQPKCYFLVWEVDCATVSREAPPAKFANKPKLRTKQAAIVDSNKNISAANQYVGLHARRNRHDLKKVISRPFDYEVDPARTPWCAAFANSILAKNGYDTTDSLLARSFLEYGIPTKDPEEGDIVVLKRGKSKWAGHVGFYVGHVERNGKTYIAVLGGNQSKSVQISYYDAKRVLGFRKPVAVEVA